MAHPRFKVGDTVRLWKSLETGKIIECQINPEPNQPSYLVEHKDGEGNVGRSWFDERLLQRRSMAE